MTWDKGFNFRFDELSVTDGANETYVKTPNYEGYYPITRNGVTFGWETDPDGIVDTPAYTSDRRLSGFVYKSNGGAVATFRVDLPNAGNFDMHAAFFDARGNTWHMQKCVVQDGSTPIYTLGPTDLNGADVFDATGSLVAPATWSTAGGGAHSLSFSSTIARFVIGDAAGSDVTTMGHLFLSEATGGGPATLQGAAVLAGLGAITAIGVRQALGAVTISGNGALLAIPKRIATGSTQMVGVSDLAAIPKRFAIGSATLSGLGSLIAQVGGIVLGACSMSGLADLVAIPKRIATGATTLSAITDLAAVGKRITFGAVQMSGLGSLIARIPGLGRLRNSRIGMRMGLGL